MPQNGVYQTKNLKLASIIYADEGIKLVGTSRDPQDSRRYLFEFEPADKAEALVEAYFAGNLKIDPKKLFASMDSLKDKIFSQEGRTNDY